MTALNLSTIQQYLRAGLIDGHLAIAPILLGAGERLFDDLDGPERSPLDPDSG